MAKNKARRSSSGSDNSKIVAVLAYFLIGIIWYYLDKSVQNNSFVKYHVNQGIILLIFSFVWHIILNILHVVSYIWGVLYLLGFVPWIFVIIGIINVLNGDKKELPIIGQYASKLNL